MTLEISFGSVGPPYWSDKPTIIVGTGPSLAGFDFKRLRGLGHIIAVKEAWRDLPFADACFGLDLPWIERLRRFGPGAITDHMPLYLAVPVGERVKVPPVIPGAIYLERNRNKVPGLATDPRHIESGGNSGYGALNLAFHKQAKLIVLFGLDYTSDHYCHQHYSHQPRDHNARYFPNWALNFREAKRVLDAHGVEVINASPKSNATAFPRVTIEQAVEHLDRIRSAEAAAYTVARESIRANMAARTVPIRGLVLDELRRQGLYRRPTEKRLGRLWDEISDAPMSTEFALSRFLVPHLAQRGWALFLDGDVMVRADLAHLLSRLDDKYAVYCVKHDYTPVAGTKMDDQVQTSYPRKNWSSVMAFNCDHPANKLLTVDLINAARGRDLHKLCWLADCDIGAFAPDWNWLVGEEPEPVDPKIVHYTLGTPDLGGLADLPYADEWRSHLHRWAA